MAVSRLRLFAALFALAALASPAATALTIGLHHALEHGHHHEQSAETGHDPARELEGAIEALVHGHEHDPQAPAHEHSAPAHQGSERLPPPALALPAVFGDLAAEVPASTEASRLLRRAPSPFATSTSLFRAFCCLLL